ncbi:MAG: M14 family metallopeptidase [Sphingomonadales bacterium]|nr:M14 family metallopeptidase [Sphingomonadales bacterium]
MTPDPIMSDCFSSTYAEARSKFLSACRDAGATTRSYVNPNGLGPEGEELATDTAWFGPADARNVMLVSSGTHGQEFYAGAATQVYWALSKSYEALPKDCAVLFVHATNPFGTAVMSRNDENNVDPNRNFLDHDFGHYTDPDFDLVVDILRVSAPTEAEYQRVADTTEALFEKHGHDRIFALTAEGQFAYPKLGGFAGIAPVWTNETVRRIVAEQLADAAHVAAIDWHSGVGDPKTLFYLCFDEPGSPEFRRACDWWGEEPIVQGTQSFVGHVRPQFRGLLVKGIGQALAPEQAYTKVIIEFGTYPWSEVRKALLADQWLRFGPGEKSNEVVAECRDFMLERFCPADKDWRDWAIGAGMDVYGKTLAGLAGASLR